MAISPWTKPLEMKIAPLPFEALAYGYEKRQKREDEGLKAFEDLESEFSKINAISQDVELRNTLLKGYKDELLKAAETAKGNYANMVPEINRIKRKFNEDINYGNLATIKTRHAAQQKSLSSLEEARKEWLKKPGEQGMSPEDFQLAYNAELQGQEMLEPDPNNPLKLTTKSGLLYKAQDARYTPNEAAIALDYASKITPEKVTEINPDLKQVEGRPGFFYNEKTDREFSLAEVRADLVANMMLANPIVRDYYNWKNTLTGKDQQAREVFNLAEQGLGVDENGNPIQINPQSTAYQDNLKNISRVVNEELYPGVFRSARAVGDLTQVNKITRDIKFEKDFESNLQGAAQSGYNVYDRPFGSPGFVAPTAQDIDDLSNVHVTATGDVPLKSPGLTQRTLGYLTNMLAGTAQTFLAAAKGLWYGPDALAKNMANPEVLESLAKSDAYWTKATNSIMNSDNTREAITKVTKAYRDKFPSLQEIPEQPDTGIQEDYNMISWYWTGKPMKRTYTYDKNSGVVFNIIKEATNNLQQISNKVVTLPQKQHDAIEKRLVSTGIMSLTPYGTFSMKDAPYTEQALEQLGDIKDIKFTGVGDYLTEGSLIFSINNQTVDFKPSDQITRQSFPVSKAAKKALLSQEKQIVQYPDGTSLIIQPDIVLGKTQNNKVRADGKDSQFTVKVTRVDRKGNVVPFELGGQKVPTLLASEYYTLFELPNYLTQFR